MFYVSTVTISHTVQVLDPNYKFAYVDGRWSRQELTSGRTCLDVTVSIH